MLRRVRGTFGWYTEPLVKRLVIAIDGPSGAGKGTLSRAISERLGYKHVDTGAMYRAVGWKAIEEGVALDSEPLVAALAARAVYQQADGKITIDGHDVTRAIRTPEMDMAARDRSDSTRPVAPLTKAADAIFIDTTDMPIEAVVHHVMMLIFEKLHPLSEGR